MLFSASPVPISGVHAMLSTEGSSTFIGRSLRPPEGAGERMLLVYPPTAAVAAAAVKDTKALRTGEALESSGEPRRFL